MINRHQCSGELRYRSFSVILLQTFTSPDLLAQAQIEGSFARPMAAGATEKEQERNIDRQLFTHSDRIIERFELQGFDIRLTVGKRGWDSPSDAVLCGHVYVRAALFFDATVQLSYRIVVSDSLRRGCRINRPFSTDELIAVAGLVQQVEHWNYNVARRQQEISQPLKSIRIWNMKLDADSAYVPGGTRESDLTFEQVQARYRNFFLARTPSAKQQYRDQHYTYIDIWEDIAHHGDDTDFDRMAEDEIIEHIETCHQAELNGLMTLYPQEWPYRTEESFADICGSNIAIDTDDLVLANQNVCVVFGTYGRRGEEAPTDWKEHLKRRESYHVSWPEFLVILEIILAKKQTINYVLNKYVCTSRGVVPNDPDESARTNESIRQIEQNARLCLRMSNILLHLDSIHYLRFMSHKHMYEKTSRNLHVAEDEQRMRQAMAQIDQALVNADNYVRIRQSERTKNILYFISIASLFGVLLQNEHVPTFSLISRPFGVTVATILICITLILIGWGGYLSAKEFFGFRKRKRNMNPDRSRRPKNRH